MTPEAQRIAIAEACGYKPTKSTGLVMDGWSKGEGWLSYHDLPDYLNDLNAMHEAEKVIQGVEELEFSYSHWLDKIVPESICPDWAIIHATAAERAEVFLRTINLWKDE